MKLFQVYPLFDVEPVSGKGCYVWDKAGNKYLDFYGGHAVISIGHTHPHFVDRVQKQLMQISFYSNSVPIALQQKLAEKLGKISGYEDWNLFLCNSGAEANENALKVASAYNRRKKILVFEKAFHGRTSLAVAATDNPEILFPVNEGPEIVRLKLNDFEGASEVLNSRDVCCVLIEGIQGVGGVNIPSREFLTHLRELCTETGTVMILDEIQSGYGRPGRFFAHQHAKVTPDLVTIAKGMGNGFPVAGVMIHPKFKASHGMLGTTFGGNHLACAAALSVLEVIEEEQLISLVEATGTYLSDQLSGLPGVKEIRGKGLMIGIEFDAPVAELRKQLLYDQQVFTGSSSNKHTLRLLPPLIAGEEEADEFVRKLKKVLS